MEKQTRPLPAEKKIYEIVSKLCMFWKRQSPICAVSYSTASGIFSSPTYGGDGVYQETASVYTVLGDQIMPLDDVKILVNDLKAKRLSCMKQSINDVCSPASFVADSV